MSETIRELRTADIVPGNNDRTKFDADKLQELATSIREHGLIQPITVRPGTHCPDCDTLIFHDDGPLTHCPDCATDELHEVFQIVAGERRFRASKLAGLDTIRAIVRTMSREQVAIAMLAENVARDDLDAMDEARAYQTRIDEYGWTIAECAKHAGVSTIRVQFRTKLLRLRADLQKLVSDGHLALGYARVLADGDLDNNRQLIAVRKLRESASPTPAWFRKVVGELVEQQSQDSLFSLDLWTIETLDDVETVETKNPPTPTTTAAPIVGSSPAAILHNQAQFWADAAAQWGDLGKSFKRNECLAAAAALEQAAAALSQ